MNAPSKSSEARLELALSLVDNAQPCIAVGG